jgi:hypothetical protein
VTLGLSTEVCAIVETLVERYWDQRRVAARGRTEERAAAAARAVAYRDAVKIALANSEALTDREVSRATEAVLSAGRPG